MSVIGETMEQIHFFTPVTYQNSEKTLPQRALEKVDEYFCLGNKFHVSIFSSDQNPTQSYFSPNDQNCVCSWTHISIKVASYFTLIFPLIALFIKGTLRFYLQISTIPLQKTPILLKKEEPKKPETSDLNNRQSLLQLQDLPISALERISFFLNDEEQENLILSGKAFYEKLKKPEISCQTNIELLKACPRSASPKFPQILVTSPFIGHDKYWLPLMKCFLLPDENNTTPDIFINRHIPIANTIKTLFDKKQISEKQVELFVTCLEKKVLRSLDPWVGHRSLEKYAELFRNSPVKRIMDETLLTYLTFMANHCIHEEVVTHQPYALQGRAVSILETCIDPRKWFGFSDQTSSFLHQAQMPALLVEILLARIQSLQQSHAQIPFLVEMTGRVEAILPRNFTIALAQKIVEQKIFLECNSTSDELDLQNSTFIKISWQELDFRAMERTYPQAFTSQ